VFKPVDNQSSRGVSVANSPAEVARAFATARSAARSEVIVEGFLVGQEVTVEGYCGAGVPTAVCISDKAHYGDLPVAHRLTYPADLTASQMEAVVAANTRTVRALGLDTGVTHAEYMVGGDAVSLVEIAARGGGSYVYTDILPTLANRQIPAAYIRHLMGGEWMIGNPILADPDAPKAANLAFFRFRPGRVTSVRGLEEARTVAGVARLDLDLRVGDEVPPVADDRSRHGLVVVFAPSRTEALARTEAVYERVKLTIDGTEHAGRPPLSPAGDPKRGNDGI
jgi:carbamoyl-phosphate synthase large subunit